MKLLKWMGALSSLGVIGMLVACGGIEPVIIIDAAAQLEEDIAIIEEYLADKGFTDYDTLESEVRVVILENGTGSALEHNDIVRYHYIGKLTDDQIFDTTLGVEAYNQDLENADSFEYQKDANDDFIIDVNGNKRVQKVDYKDKYQPIYDFLKIYVPFITTHTPGGWYLKQTLLPGMSDGTNHVFENANVDGRGLILLPSGQAYGPRGIGSINPNTPLIFEIRIVSKQ